MAQTERKEQVTNELAKGLVSAYEGLKKGPSRGTVIVLAVVVAVVLLGLLWWWYYVSTKKTESKRWFGYDGATYSAEIASAEDDKDLEGSNQLMAYRFQAARLKLNQGVRGMGSTDPKARKKARDDVGEAKETYEGLIKKASSLKASSLSPLLHQEALWGAGKANEALGDVGDAKDHYEKLSKEYPSSALGKEAKKQLQRLEDDAVKAKIREVNNKLDR
jgi:hypothetical protein